MEAGPVPAPLGLHLVLDVEAGDPGLLSAAEAWAECLDGRPRIARSAFSWERDEASS